jgi:serine/threonine protein phosphatase PrpC
MTVFQFLKRGAYHAEFCEDFSVVQATGEHRVVCAVMDGCTMGQESHFASTLLAKVLRKVIKERQYQQFYGALPNELSVEEEFQQILSTVFNEMRQLRNQLLLDTAELLTTLVLVLLDTQTREAIILAVGDATIAINGQITRFEQDNRPDYLAYHLGRPFSEWYHQQRQVRRVAACTDLSIATDGIDSFQTVPHEVDVPDVPAYLLLNRDLLERREMLDIKVKRLENVYSLIPTDDVAIIRVVLE